MFYWRVMTEMVWGVMLHGLVSGITGQRSVFRILNLMWLVFPVLLGRRARGMCISGPMIRLVIMGRLMIVVLSGLIRRRLRSLSRIPRACRLFQVWLMF